MDEEDKFDELFYNSNMVDWWTGTVQCQSCKKEFISVQPAYLEKVECSGCGEMGCIRL